MSPGSERPHHLAHGCVDGLVLPESQGHPPQPGEVGIGVRVPPDVALQLLPPPLPVVHRRGQACQKQPCTNTAVRHFTNVTSARRLRMPGIGESTRYRKPSPCSARLRVGSGAVSRLRCAGISRRALASLGAGMPLRWVLRLTRTPTAAQPYRSPRHGSMWSASHPAGTGDVSPVDPGTPPAQISPSRTIGPGEPQCGRREARCPIQRLQDHVLRGEAVVGPIMGRDTWSWIVPDGCAASASECGSPTRASSPANGGAAAGG